jgi:hypothetical protein
LPPWTLVHCSFKDLKGVRRDPASLFGVLFETRDPVCLLGGNAIGYTRSFEVKQLSVPVSKAEELRKLYRIIASDERTTAVLKPAK